MTRGSEQAPESVILVVDDSRVDLQVAAHLLRKRPNTRVLSALDARSALAEIEQHHPDLVITDMQMPEMDGFQLVEAINTRYPYLPAVLMTAHGSEEIAMRALQRGAASFVRKQDSAERLIDTVDEVLALTAGRRQQARLWSSWVQTESQWQLDNDPTLIPVLAAHLRNYLNSLAYHNETVFIRISVALHEALTNAMFHGNLELDSTLREQDPAEYYRQASLRRTQSPYAERRVYVRLCETADSSRYIVRDEGPGFDVAAHRPDPRDAANLHRSHGRGLFLIHMFMDEVRFNEAGNEITMIHHRLPPGE